MKNYKNYIRILIVILFLIVPFISSFISTIHLIDFFLLGNTNFIAILTAIVYEIGSIASFIVPFVLKKINKSLIWTIFLILASMQIFGNIYFSFDFINQQLIQNPNWLGSFQELVSFFVGNDSSLIKFVVSSMIGIPIPLISLFFLKSIVDYVNPNEITETIKKEENFIEENDDKIITNSEKENEIYNLDEISEVVGDNRQRKNLETNLNFK